MQEELKTGNRWCFVRLKNKVWMTCTSKKHSLSRLKQTTWSVKCKVFCWRFRCEQEPHKFQRMYVKSNETIAFDAKGKKNKRTQEKKRTMRNAESNPGHLGERELSTLSQAFSTENYWKYIVKVKIL